MLWTPLNELVELLADIGGVANFTYIYKLNRFDFWRSIKVAQLTSEPVHELTSEFTLELLRRGMSAMLKESRVVTKGTG